MKTSLIFALKNINRYRTTSFVRSVLLFFLTLSVVSASMFSMSMTSSVSDILNSRSSGNTVLIKTDESRLSDISALPFIKEACIFPERSFTSGEIAIENVGTFDINCCLIKSKDKNALIPQTYTDEFKVIGGDKLLVAGRLPENDNEMIIDSKYTDGLQIYDYAQILGKKASVYYPFFGETIYDVNQAVIVGVYSGELLNITALSGVISNSKDSACCFLYDKSCSYGGYIVAYCALENINVAYATLLNEYGAGNLIKSTLTTKPFNELINISSFIKNVMALICIVLCMVYAVTQIIVLTNYLHEKRDFVSAINAFGLRNGQLFFVFVFEYLFVSIIPFVLSSALSVVFTKSISRYVSVLAGIKYTTAVSLLPIIVSFAVVLTISLITICIAVYAYKPVRNE